MYDYQIVLWTMRRIYLLTTKSCFHLKQKSFSLCLSKFKNYMKYIFRTLCATVCRVQSAVSVESTRRDIAWKTEWIYILSIVSMNNSQWRVQSRVSGKNTGYWQEYKTECRVYRMYELSVHLASWRHPVPTYNGNSGAI